MSNSNGYFRNGDKISKVTEDGLRINFYPSGIPLVQMPGQSHKSYKKGFGKAFSNQSPQEMSNYVSALFKK